MLRRFRAWLEKERRWKDEHRRAWAGVAEPGPDGLSSFHGDTEAAIQAALQDRGLTITSREIVRTRGGVEDHIVAEVLELEAKMWIYRDQTDVVTPKAQLRLEEWDARTPEAHRARVVAFLDSL